MILLRPPHDPAILALGVDEVDLTAPFAGFSGYCRARLSEPLAPFLVAEALRHVQVNHVKMVPNPYLAPRQDPGPR